MTTKLEQKTDTRADAIIGAGCLFAVVGAILAAGAVPLILLFLGYGGWAAMVSFVPAALCGAGAGGAIGIVVGAIWPGS